MSRKVIVAGSYSAAIFFKGKRIPLKGETLIADTFFESFGGKGSNQALAAGKLGADVRFICKIGVDRYADDVIALYKHAGIYSDSIVQDPEKPTSIGAIFIDEQGANAIMIALGANANLTAQEIIDWVKKEKDPFVAGFQLESDVDTVLESIRAIHKAGIKTLLDPAPAVKLPEDIFKHITFIKPNEHEAKVLSGIEIKTPEDAYQAGEWFIDKGVGTAIITLGEGGTVLVDKNRKQHFKALPTEAADTTGAGDIFSGALMAALSREYEMGDAIRYASCAAAISVTRMGVVDAIPELAETQALYERFRRGEIT